MHHYAKTKYFCLTAKKVAVSLHECLVAVATVSDYWSVGQIGPSCTPHPPPPTPTP